MNTSWEIRCGDALELLKEIPSASIDCIVTDPPYGDTSLAWDVIVSGWTDEAMRALKPSGSMWVFASMRYLTKLMPTMSKWHMVQEIVWEKHNGSSMRNDRFFRVHEYAVQFIPCHEQWGKIYKSPQYTHGHRPYSLTTRRKPTHFSQATTDHQHTSDGRRLQRSVMKVHSMHGRAVHPTQKPEGIIEPLVKYSCPHGGRILDPFSGSGTTGVVAVRHGRSYIGLELNPTYAEISRKRVDEAWRQGVQQRIEGVA